MAEGRGLISGNVTSGGSKGSGGLLVTVNPYMVEFATLVTAVPKVANVGTPTETLLVECIAELHVPSWLLPCSSKSWVCTA